MNITINTVFPSMVIKPVDPTLYDFVNDLSTNLASNKVGKKEISGKLHYTNIEDSMIPIGLIMNYNDNDFLELETIPLYIYAPISILQESVWEGLPYRTKQIPNPDYITPTYEEVEIPNPLYIEAVLDENGVEIEPAFGTPTITELQVVTEAVGEPTLEQVRTFEEWKMENETNPIMQNDTHCILRCQVGGKFLNKSEREVLFNKHNVNNIEVLGVLEFKLKATEFATEPL